MVGMAKNQAVRLDDDLAADTEALALRLAQAACILGLLYAAVSAYWGLGSTWLLDTVGGSFEEQGRAGNVSFLLVAWAAAALKIVAAVLPLLALRRLTRQAWNRAAWVLAWVEAAILTIYGLVWTTVGVLVQADVIRASATTAERRALAWHTYFWDPWFLIWGLLVGLALVCGRNRRKPVPTGAGPTAALAMGEGQDRPRCPLSSRVDS